MARNGYLILDSDLHMMEPDDLWARYLEGPHRANLPKFFGGQQRTLTVNSEDKGNADTIMGMEVAGLAIPAHGKAAGATASSRELRRRSRARHPHFQVARGSGFDPESTLTAMDIEGVDVAVMYGTRSRQILMHDDLAPDYAAALARAYNNWASDYCRKRPDRLKFAAQVAMHSIPAAIDEARRCVRELGAVAIIGTPNPVNGQHLHDEACDPLWSALEELDVPIGFHPTGNTSLKDDAGRRYVGHANFQPIAHAIRNPVELMGAIASMTTGRGSMASQKRGSRRRGALRRDEHRVERLPRGHEEPIALRPSERDVGAHLGQADPAQQLAVRIPHGDAAVAEPASAGIAVARDPEVPADVGAHAVGAALDAVHHEVAEELLVRHLVVGAHVEDVHVAIAARVRIAGAAARADDVELLVVG